MKVRPACVAGQFYEGTQERLRDQVLHCLPKTNPPQQEVLGAVVPHAGLLYSGGVAGSVYASIRLPSTCVLLGPNHTGEGAPLSLSTFDVWETPLGRTKVDGEFAKALLEEDPHLKRDEAAHQWEHSLEVQLPFIQHLAGTVKIVPIILGFQPVQVYRTLGEALARVILGFSRQVLVLASSDMTHYEPHEVVQTKDREAIESILALDETQLMRRVKERNISMCGYAPTVALLTCVKRLGAKEGRLIKYQTSGDSSGDYRSVVGYAGIVLQ